MSHTALSRFFVSGVCCGPGALGGTSWDLESARAGTGMASPFCVGVGVGAGVLVPRVA